MLVALGVGDYRAADPSATYFAPGFGSGAVATIALRNAPAPAEP